MISVDWYCDLCSALVHHTYTWDNDISQVDDIKERYHILGGRDVVLCLDCLGKVKANGIPYDPKSPSATSRPSD